MATSPPPPSYHSISTSGMGESGPTIPDGISTQEGRNSTESVLPVTLYIYLLIKADRDYPLPPAFHAHNVIQA